VVAARDLVKISWNDPNVVRSSEVLTLVLSLLALGVSGASLTWKIISWRRSGARVKVKPTSGIGGAPPGVWFVGIQATNRGRLGTQIEQFGFQLPNGRHMQNIYDFLGQSVQFPIPLGPGARATMTYAADHIREALREQGLSGKKVRPYVTTGHRHIEGKRTHLGKWIEHLHH
jgi:hypothetical protein